MNTSDLREFMEQHNLLQLSKKTLFDYLREWEKENIKDFQSAFKCELDSISCNLRKVQLVINYSFDNPVEYVQIILDIVRLEQVVAQYSYLVDLNGTIMDDGVIFEARGIDE